MRHDYNLPADWHDRTDAEKSKWLTQERCRRQAMSQRTATRRRLRKQRERTARKQAANPASVDVEANR